MDEPNGPPSPEERTPEVVAVSVEETPPPAPAPESTMEAVFELGATQEALQNLRRETAENREETARLSVAVGDLASMVETFQADLSAVREEELEIQEHQEQETRASWWERMMGAH